MNIVKDLCTVVREVLATAVAVVGIATRMSLCQAIDGYRARLRRAARTVYGSVGIVGAR